MVPSYIEELHDKPEWMDYRLSRFDLDMYSWWRNQLRSFVQVRGGDREAKRV